MQRIVKLRRSRWLCGAVLLSASCGAAADVPVLRWNGFLNVVGGLLEKAPVQDSADGKGATGYAGYSNTLEFQPQTSAGLQVSRQLDASTLVTAQVYAEGRTHNYDANLKWLYLSRDIGDSARLRVGRIGLPLYYYSDFLKVGYAYHWLMPPGDVYLYDSTLAGLDVVTSHVWGPLEWSVEAFAGGDDQYLANIRAQTRTRNAVGGVVTVSTGGWLTLRAMAMRQDASFDIEGLEPDTLIDRALASAVEAGTFPDPATAAAAKPQASLVMTPYLSTVFGLDDITNQYRELAVRMEFSRWFGMAEWTELDSGSYLQDVQRSWYASSGVRFDDIVCHLTYSEYHQPLAAEPMADARSLPASGAPADIALWLARQTSAALAVGYAGDWYTQIGGVSWYASPSTVWKAEITHFNNVATLPSETQGVGLNTLVSVGVSATF